MANMRRNRLERTERSDEEAPAPRRRRGEGGVVLVRAVAHAAAPADDAADPARQAVQHPPQQQQQRHVEDASDEQEDDEFEDEEEEEDEDDEFEEEAEDEEEDFEDEEELFGEVYGYEVDDAQPGIRLPGGRDWDVVIGFGARPGPQRATGALPEALPDDEQIAPGVWARRQPDGHHCLFGSPLRHVPKLLQRMFKMEMQPGQLLWRAELALTDAEWSYITRALAADRIQPLLMRGERVKVPLPDFGFPERLRPRDSSGQPLRGPRKSGPNAKPWNVGRQFFSSFVDGDPSSFIWADGVRAMEPEAQESFGDWAEGSFFMF